MNQHGKLWPLIGVHSQVLAEVLDTAERWLVQGKVRSQGNSYSIHAATHCRLLLVVKYSLESLSDV